ncbi:hypothetical protein WMO24_15690 [Ruthenibacterium sp. CLA-JM-H11]|uniref:Uncharacterized protein n=1 Tax=Ruthenibacterium intestinale TaxID=3133163 RepID=A0ABV1GJM8_9FIRM
MYRLVDQLIFHDFYSLLFENPFSGNTLLVSAVAKRINASARLSAQPIYWPAGPRINMRPIAG